MKYVRMALCLGALAGSVAQGLTQEPQPIDYVRVCDIYGSGFFYIPGTETCLNADTQETRRETEFGTDVGKTSFARSVDERIEKAFEAGAISNALQAPDLVAGETFGIRVNWGAVESAQAVGVTSAFVLTDGLFDNGKGRLAGSVGLGLSGETVGGNAGLQLTW